MAGQEILPFFLVLILCESLLCSAVPMAVSPAMHSSPSLPNSPGLMPIPNHFAPEPAPYFLVPVPVPSPVAQPPELALPFPTPYPAPTPTPAPVAPGPVAQSPEPNHFAPEPAPYFLVPSPVAQPPELALPFPTPYPAPTPTPAPVAPGPVAQSPEPIIFYPPEPATIPGPIASPSPSNPSPIRQSKGVKAAYWPSFNGFPVSSIDTSYFTHIYYAFLLPNSVTYNIAITPNDETMLPSFISTLRSQKSTVKTMLSIGGAGNIPEVFSAIANSSSNRAVFIQSAIGIARQYGFDGVDLDWEFPLNQQDMDNLGVLYKEWRKALNNEAMATGRTRLLLTSAVYYSSTVPLDGVTRTYPGESIRKHVDWVNPMCYDYHGSWENNTGLHSALFDPKSVLSTQYGVNSWLGIGVPRKKVVMGLPVYGHTWTLKDPNVHTVGAAAVGIGPGFEGFYTYSEVANFNNMNNATVVYDLVMESMYSYAGNIWMGYDDPNTIGKKVQFARSNDLRGYFLWALGQDLDWDISRQAYYAWGH